MIRAQVLVCGGTGCTSSGSNKIQEAFQENIAAFGLENEVKIVQTGCFGLCALGPIMIVYPEGAFYSCMTEENVPRVVKEHLIEGKVCTDLLYKETVAEDGSIAVHKAYTVRASLSKVPVEIEPATAEAEAVIEDRIMVSMAQRTYIETQLRALSARA